MNVSRNDPCPCGSGLKFKKCCGKNSNNASHGTFASAAPQPIEFDRLVSLFHAGRYGELEHQAASLLEKFPESGLSWKLLCASLQMQGKNALRALQMAAKFLPEDAEAHNNLGLALQDVSQIESAVASYRQSLRVNPDDAAVWNNLGTALHDLGQYEGAVGSYHSALRLKPDYAVAYNNRGIAFQELRRYDDAVVSYRRALEIDPDYAEAHCNLGIALVRLGQLDDAINSYLTALKINPDSLDANRAYLAALLYQPAITSDTLFEKITSFTARMCLGLREINRPFPNSLEPCRKLRIGYVSSDFRYHPVGRNIMPLIGCHDRSKFEIYLYGNVLKPDSVTEWFKGAVAAWRSIVGVSDQDAAEMIRRDGIDILVFLAGRFDDNRPLIAACRAAPVQVSFHDPVSSGLKGMDYLLTDHALSPPDTKERFTERLFHLPTFYVHPPSIDMPDVKAPPARVNGYVTFGSFNNLSKVNEKVVALWSRVLHAVPDARLTIKYQNVFGNESTRRRYLGLFQEQGIEARRLDLVSASDTGGQHLARYAGIDIALDTFPFTGSTTTFEALWMGVPVVSLLGDHMVARWSGAMLKKLKLDELVARDEAGYVNIAQGLAQDLDRLESLRFSLRERVARSPLCDEQGRAYQIEKAFRWMWAKWCAEGGRIGEEVSL
ncbi:MAG: tetratricopeptide repeat protein [Burkholderiales bacterium]|nr:tetratricopeptide repeat protein [Burkholderiales bacterium]